MLLYLTTLFSSQRHLLAQSIETTCLLSLILIIIRGGKCFTFAAVVTPDNKLAPIRASSIPEIHSGGVTTPVERSESDANLKRICIALCSAGLGGLPCEPYQCSELFSSIVKNSGVGDVVHIESYQQLIASDKKLELEHGDLKRPLTPPVGAPKIHYCDKSTNANHGRPPNSHPTTESTPSVSIPRRKVCGMLCNYNLGLPLCECDKRLEYPPINTERVCVTFCTWYGYQIDGCPICLAPKLVEDGSYQQRINYHKLFNKHGPANTLKSNFPAIVSATAHTARKQIDWNQWCKDRCAEGDGGAACNCDILPLNFLV